MTVVDRNKNDIAYKKSTCIHFTTSKIIKSKIQYNRRNEFV